MMIFTYRLVICYITNWKITMLFSWKIHELNGDFPVRDVKLPEGTVTNKHSD